ncbi:MAG: response regulator [Lachnospiraceae bacterium]|nr:response regulator [Lachnospiraceae bacterium]
MKQKTAKTSRIHDILYKVIQNTVAVLITFTVIVYITGQFFVKNPSFYNPECEKYPGIWTHTASDGETSVVEPASTVNVAGEKDVYFNTVLPDNISEGYYLFIKTGKNFSALVDGRERCNYFIEQSLFGKTSKSIWLPIKLSPDDAGKTLSIVRRDYSGDTTLMPEFYYGNKLGFIQWLLSSNIFILLLSFSLLIFDFIIMLACIVYRIRTGHSFALMYLTISVFTGAAWLILDNFFYPFIFGNYYIDGIVEFMIVILLPFPFTSYMNILQERRYQKYVNIINLVLIIEFLLFSVLHFANISSFNESMLFILIGAGISTLITLGIMCYDLFIKKNRDYVIVAVGFSIFILFALGEIGHLFYPGHTNDGIYISIGLIALLLLAVYNEISNISNMHIKAIEAQSSNNAKSVFLANMSHEIRTPINAIMGMNELILREDINDTVKEYATNARDASLVLLDIVNDILDFSKIEQGKMELIEDKYDIARLLAGVISMMQIKADEKGLKLLADISPELPRTLIGDSKRVREIIMNLMSNAVKYTEKGSVTLTVYMDGTGETPVLIISVKDTGIGIREEDRDKLFKQFERLDYNKNRNIEGTGLGLAITSGFVKLMGGTIACESVYGKGSEFIAEIPQKIADKTAIGDIDKIRVAMPDNEEKGTKDLRCPDAKILVVDDNRMNLKVAERFINLTGATVFCAKSGKEMLRLITGEKYDLILLDHMMPEMDGIAALEKAKAMSDNINKDTPYIALTANAILGAEEMYISRGFADYLSKPITIDSLNEILIKYLPSGKIIK